MVICNNIPCELANSVAIVFSKYVWDLFWCSVRDFQMQYIFRCFRGKSLSLLFVNRKCWICFRFYFVFSRFVQIIYSRCCLWFASLLIRYIYTTIQIYMYIYILLYYIVYVCISFQPVRTASLKCSTFACQQTKILHLVLLYIDQT